VRCSGPRRLSPTRSWVRSGTAVVLGQTQSVPQIYKIWSRRAPTFVWPIRPDCQCRSLHELLVRKLSYGQVKCARSLRQLPTRLQSVSRIDQISSMRGTVSVGVTCDAYLLELGGPFTYGSRPGRTVGESVGRIFQMDCSDWSDGIRYHIFDTRPDTDFKLTCVYHAEVDSGEPGVTLAAVSGEMTGSDVDSGDTSGLFDFRPRRENRKWVLTFSDPGSIVHNRPKSPKFAPN